MEWQPIETAPKDGSFVIVRLGNSEVFSAQWTQNGWHAASDIGWVRATHWMPLPAPPNV
jgi:hypothetical protein